jgi:hypothetical protein
VCSGIGYERIGVVVAAGICVVIRIYLGDVVIVEMG